MLQIVVIMLSIFTAACQFTISPTVPLSLPLPDGAMFFNCSDVSMPFDNTHPDGCTIEGLSLYAEGLCFWSFSESEMAHLQYGINLQRDLCYFHGVDVVAPQLLLNTNAAAILNNLNAQDQLLRQKQVVFFALQIVGGHIGLPILLIVSVFFRRPRPDPTFLNFCLTCVFSAIIFSIGLYRRGPASTELDGFLVFVRSEPLVQLAVIGSPLPFIHSELECLVQAVLVPGAQVMTDASMCAVMVQLWLDFRAAVHEPRGTKTIQWTRAVLLATPYAALLAFMMPALRQLQTAHKLTSFQGMFYCVLKMETLYLPMYGTMLVILAVTLVLDVCIIHLMYRRWHAFPRFVDNQFRIPLSVVLRVALFCMYHVITAIAYCVAIMACAGVNGSYRGLSKIDVNALNFVPVWIDMLQAGAPSAAFIILATRQEYLEALMFWRRTSLVIPTLSKELPVTPSPFIRMIPGTP